MIGHDYISSHGDVELGLRSLAKINKSDVNLCTRKPFVSSISVEGNKE